MQTMDNIFLHPVEEDIHVDLVDSTLTDTQGKVLSLLPVLSACLSIWGSASIIHMVLSSDKRTPYRRILLGMSCCDVVSSFNFALQAFLVPAATSHRIWAVGNASSCSAMGFFQQLSFSNIGYSCMLSIYFLLTIKFAIREKEVAKKYEPMMHIVSVGWPLLTASVGAGMGVYDELSVGHGCWVTNYPKNCDSPDTPPCQSPMIAWIFAGIPAFVLFVIVFISNVLVFCHVRYTIQRSRQHSQEFNSQRSFRSCNTKQRISDSSNATGRTADASLQFSHHQDEERQSASQRRPTLTRLESSLTLAIQTTSRTLRNSTLAINSMMTKSEADSQIQRIKAVATQAFLYVGAFLMGSVWFFTVRNMEAQKERGMHDENKLFPLLVMQAIFMPLQGFFNCLIYCRPAYLHARSHFPEETRIWAFRRALHGSKVQPTKQPANNAMSSQFYHSEEPAITMAAASRALHLPLAEQTGSSIPWDNLSNIPLFEDESSVSLELDGKQTESTPCQAPQESLPVESSEAWESDARETETINCESLQERCPGTDVESSMDMEVNAQQEVPALCQDTESKRPSDYESALSLELEAQQTVQTDPGDLENIPAFNNEPPGPEV